MRQIALMLLVVLFAPQSLEAQNRMQMKRRWIAADKLSYFTDSQFPRLVRDGMLVEIRDTATRTIDRRIDRDGRYIRPYVLQALAPLDQAYFKAFREPLPLSAAFRTQEHHAELRTRNSNAARGQSPHSTGYTIDISYAWMSRAQQRFVEKWFAQRHGKTLVYTKERFQKCYDVFFRPPKLVPMPRHRKIKR